MSIEVPRETTLYGILGVARTATSKDLLSAYRRLSRIYHPDANQDGDTEAFVNLADAYAVLGSPKKRKIYDSTLPKAKPAKSNNGHTNLTTPRRGIVVAIEVFRGGLY